VTALEVFAAAWGEQCPAIVKLWRAHWEQFTPFLTFPSEVRRVIYKNLIESLNPRLRKVTRNRCQFLSEQATATSRYETWMSSAAPTSNPQLGVETSAHCVGFKTQTERPISAALESAASHNVSITLLTDAPILDHIVGLRLAGILRPA
jgi:hypothetical protein